MFEVIASFLFGGLISAIAYYITNRSLKVADNIEPQTISETKDISKKKQIVIKSKPKPKTSKSEVKVKQTKQNDTVIEKTINVKKISDAPVIPNGISLLAESNRKETSISGWKEVNKGSKKAIKKDIKPAEEVVPKKTNDNKKAKLQSAVSESKKSKEAVEVIKPVSKIVEEPKTEEVKEIVVEIKEVPKQAVPVTQNTKQEAPKQNSASNTDEMELRKRIGELMTELDKAKHNLKDDNKNTTASINQLNKEIEAMKLKLKTAQAAESRLLEDLTKSQGSNTGLRNQFMIIQKELTKNIVVVQAINREKTQMKADLDKLELDNQTLHKQLDTTEQQGTELAQRIEQETTAKYSGLLQKCEEKSKQQIATLQTERQHLQEQLMHVQTDLIEHNKLQQNLQQELLTYKSAESSLANVTRQFEATIADQHATIEDLRQRINQRQSVEKDGILHLQKVVDETVQKNAMLEEKNKTLQVEIDVLTSQTNAAAAMETQKFNEEIDSLRQQLESKSAEHTENVQTLSQTVETVKELTDINKQKQDEIDSKSQMTEKYKSGLQSTEAILSNLQKSVNEEEEKWRDSLMKSESEAEKSKQELERVYEVLLRIKNSRMEKNELNFAYHCVDKSLSSLIDEMEAKMEHLETSLENVIQERDEAISHINGNQVNGSGDGEENLEHLRQQLSAEKELSISLQKQCTKYQALVDIGRESLNVEKMKRSQFQENETNAATAQPDTLVQSHEPQQLPADANAESS